MHTRDTQQLQSLLELAAQGNDEVYERVIEHASLRLLNLTRRMLRNYPRLRRWEQTDDVFQNAALRLHRSLAAVKPDSVRRFMGLAATQVRRTLIDLARHHFGPEGRHTKHHSDYGFPGDAKEGVLQAAEAENVQPETLEAWVRFHQHVEELPEPQREVFDLVWYASMQQQQVAELLGISLATVKRRLRSVRLQLASELEGKM